MVAYYTREWAAAAAKLSDSVAGLLMWDLLCTAALTSAPAAFTNLAKASYLVQGDGTPTPRTELLGTLFAPLRAVIEDNVDVPLIVGCQEMPRAEGPLEAALPAGTSVYRHTILLFSAPRDFSRGFVSIWMVWRRLDIICTRSS